MGTNIRFGQIMEEREHHGFFKILRKEGDLSSETMRGIPYDFIRSISEMELSLKMVLNLPWGGSWPIKICKNSRFYYMEKKGWDKFLSENALGDDEFLTFTHKGNMCFNVNIYQQNTMEMLRPKTIASSSKKQNIYKDLKKEEIGSLSSSSKTSKLNLGNKKVEEEEGTSSPVPDFTLTIKKTYLHFLGIPKKFAKMHMPKERKIFKIHYLEDKKTWEVTYVVSDLQTRFCSGWAGLAKDLGLVVGDVCTFELIKPTEMVLNVFKKPTP